jgi:hypothetical protein
MAAGKGIEKASFRDTLGFTHNKHVYIDVQNTAYKIVTYHHNGSGRLARATKKNSTPLKPEKGKVGILSPR